MWLNREVLAGLPETRQASDGGRYANFAELAPSPAGCVVAGGLPALSIV
jgi:hypothetical protein